ncbi:MgtC/SapB family protein [Candidatus Woesearchaeota archaeon]|nr:MgtC/SapB family protein [Candidatus Woesearchaeota archaeon]
MEEIIVLQRFLVAFLLSLVFGLERQRSHKPIGFGTFTFVTVGSCGLAITALTLAPENPLPLLSAIVSGIGFLGAGALLKTTDKIFGFTTAASIWVFAIFGLLIGVGEYIIGMVLYSLIWFVIFFDRYLERSGIGSYQRKIIISTNKVIPRREIRNLFEASGIHRHKLFSHEVDVKNNKVVVTYVIEGRKERINKMQEKLLKKDWFESCKIE